MQKEEDIAGERRNQMEDKPIVQVEKDGLAIRVSKLGEYSLLWIEFEKDGEVESMSMPPINLYRIIQHYHDTCPIQEDNETGEIRERPLQLL